MNQNRNPRVAVVGGGLAGLAAATHAARAGASVTLFERAGGAGGRAQTQEKDGFRFNLGPHALYPRAAAMLRDLGVDIPGAPPKVAGLALYRGRNHRLPVSTRSVLRTGLLNAADKVALGKAISSLYRANQEALAGVSLAEYLASLIGRQRVRDVIAAFMRLACYADAPDRLSAGAAVRQFTFGTGTIYVDGGWQTLVEALAAAARDAGASLRVGRRVEGVAESGERVFLALAGGTTEEFDSAILTGSPSEVGKLLPGEAALRLNQATARLIPVRAAILDLGLRKLPNPRVTFGLGIDEPLYLSVHSTWAKLAPEGSATVQLARYLAPDEDLPPGQLRAELEAWADRAQPGWREQCVVQRFLPGLVVSHALPDALAGGFAGRPAIDAAGLPGVFVAGDWVGREGMLADASLASGIAAASAAVAPARDVREAVPA